VSILLKQGSLLPIVVISSLSFLLFYGGSWADTPEVAALKKNQFFLRSGFS